MFDYLFVEQGLPFVMCPSCNNKLHFHGGYYPVHVVCQNCGQAIDLTQVLSKLTYPNYKYDTNGSLQKEE